MRGELTLRKMNPIDVSDKSEWTLVVSNIMTDRTCFHIKIVQEKQR